MNSNENAIKEYIDEIVSNKGYENGLMLKLIDLLKTASYYGVDILELYREIFINRDDIDVSIKLMFFTYFCEGIDFNRRRDLVLELISMVNTEIYELEKPIQTILLYREYRMIKMSYDEKFDSLLLLNDKELHEVLCKKLCTRVTDTKGKYDEYLSIESISYDDNFESQLRKRIGNISDEKLQYDITNLIKNARLH